ncbi:glutamate--cysteine ligase [uncultured Roseobacter sp.]|uniref:glutamate--cysteine ligase n=1 Tax=uncultured Roseobacter sp. TaxID=114847 RepID=UPI00262B6859|nr:glutamate--cysteine ligase [uncultured Roseobacter sp.]
MSIPQSGGGPITSHDQLAQYLSDGCKPKEDWRIGTEHEKFGYCKDTLKPLPYEGDRSIRVMLEGLRDTHGWSPVEEGGHLIGLEKDGANISLEPGGQLELSGAPLETIHETCDEVNTHLREVQDVADRIGAGFIGLGAAPVWRHDDMDLMPKGRYKLMNDYMGRVGTMGRVMMRRTCTVQVNLDFGSEADMVQKMRVALALQPVATALFANSPFFEGRPNGHKSWRSVAWRNLDAARTGMLPFVFEDGFGFERWVDYALDVPMYFVYRDGQYVDALGQSFRDFLKGELPALPGEIPTLSDWADHLTTAFPEARMKRFIEMRGADGGPWRRLCALPAFWVGLMYDQTALDAAWDLVKSWDMGTRDLMRVAASVDGLQAEVHGIKLHDIAREAVAISMSGLKSRARAGAGGMVPDETHFLNALHESIESGKVPADELLEQYNGAWDGDLSRIYAEYSY